MKQRHKLAKRADGGAAPKPDWYSGAGSNVAKEAEEKKKGGAVRKKGGAVHGSMAKKRLDKPGRKRGGAVGADMKPLSSAYKETDAVGHPTEDND